MSIGVTGLEFLRNSKLMLVMVPRDGLKLWAVESLCLVLNFF